VLRVDGGTSAGNDTTHDGIVTDYAQAIKDNRAKGWYVFDGTTESWIMGCHTPQTLPVLSALARGFAVCDHWYASAPTMTMPNGLSCVQAPARGTWMTSPKSSPWVRSSVR